MIIELIILAVLLVGAGIFMTKKYYAIPPLSQGEFSGGIDNKFPEQSIGTLPTGQSFYSKVAQENGISFDEVVFIEESFKKHGKGQGAAFGDLTGGLEPIAKGNQLKIKKTEGSFEVEIVGDTWDLNISIDSRTGDWLAATTGDLVPDPS